MKKYATEMIKVKNGNMLKSLEEGANLLGRIRTISMFTMIKKEQALEFTWTGLNLRF